MSGALVYRSFDGNVWLADPDGSNAVAISDVAGGGECPGEGFHSASWSPDGRFLALNRFSDCPGRSGLLVIAHPQGDVVAHASVPQRRLGRIVWSPDSDRFAMIWQENSDPQAAIAIYGIDGSRETQIAMPRGWPTYGQDPIWTPDGASLIVNGLEVPIDGGPPREVPFREVFPAVPELGWRPPLAYSPDGSQAAYGTEQGLMVARSDGSEPRELFADSPYTATWSPTGELIAFTAGAGEELAPKQLHVVDVATGSATLLFEGEPGTWLNVIGFSPEGDRILFGEEREVSVANGTVVHSLWSIGVDGSDARRVVGGTNQGAWRSR
jgi:Tol biopolymer transport system component